jgi:hypothetical protein
VAALLSGLWIVTSSLTARADLVDCHDAYKELARKPKARAMAVSQSKQLCYYGWGYNSQKDANGRVLADCDKEANDCRLLDAERDIALLKKQQQEGREKEVSDIKQAQTKLKELDLYSGEIDGQRGPGTIAAVKAFQSRIGIAQNGEITSGLLARLSEDEQTIAKRDRRSICFGALGYDRSGWSSSAHSDPNVSEAKRRGLSVDDCRVAIGLPRQVAPTIVQSTVDRDTRSICFGALGYDRSGWSSSAHSEPNVSEAKRRGLSVDDCRVAIGLPRQVAPTIVQSTVDRDTRSICFGALGYDRSGWSSSAHSDPNVSEAKRRGLSVDDCRVAIGLSVASKSYDDGGSSVPSPPQETHLFVGIAQNHLCYQLLNTQRDNWLSNANVNLMAEAKRRELSIDDCRVAIGLDPLNATSSQTPKVVEVNPPTPKPLSLSEICELSLNSDRTDWSSTASATEARRQADALGITLQACQSQLGIKIEQKTADTSSANDQTAENNIPVSPSTPLQKKVALVMGNSNYRHSPVLANPHNDAEAVASALTILGFEVIKGLDLSNSDTVAKVREFAKSAKTADLSLLYYAGHGLQIAGENYIVPVDAVVEDETAISFELINVSTITNFMGGLDKVGVVLLDACRDNPFSRSLKRSLSASRAASVEQGLAPISAEGGGLFVAFSTAPGDVAADGEGMTNSPFTTALLKHLPTKGLEINTVMTRVKAEVAKMTKNDQRPWTNSDLTTEVYLVPEQ